MSEIIPRGIRNNNPFNIRHSKNQWQGSSSEQSDPDFVTFDSPIMGIRAAMKIIQNYYTKYNLCSVWEMISRWAPPSENPTDTYAGKVAAQMGVDVNDEVNILTNSSMMIKMTQGMILMENGSPEKYNSWIYRNEAFWYPQAVYQAAWASAHGK